MRGEKKINTFLQEGCLWAAERASYLNKHKSSQSPAKERFVSRRGKTLRTHIKKIIFYLPIQDVYALSQNTVLFSQNLGGARDMFAFANKNVYEYDFPAISFSEWAKN